ncbi:MAG: cytochrome c oxidase assembly protein [Brachybacterium sp.]|nr:cytochrome c oxidase assembly protein [Brachybacterium sp.]
MSATAVRTPATTMRQSGWAVVVGAGAAAILLGALAVVVGLRWTGGADAPLLGDPGPLVRWGLPVVTVLARLAAALTVGALLMCATVLPPGDARRRCLDVGTAAAAVWALTQAAEAVLTQIQRIGQPPTELPVSVLVSVPAAGPLLAATVLAAVVACCTLLVRTSASALAVGVLALVALAPIAETGHAAGGEGHGSAGTSMWLHLIAVGIWSGGLAALLASRTTDSRAASRFSQVAGWMFVVVAVSGVINTTLRIETPTDLLTSPWGHLLLLKVVLFTALGLAGHLHRTRTLAALSRRGDARDFQRLAGGEIVLLAATYGVSVALGASAPPTPDVSPLPHAGDVVITLTGAPLPPPPTVLTYLTQWRVEPVLLVLTVSALVVYLRWVRRLSRRGDHWPVSRTVCAVTGLVLFGWMTNGGPAVYGAVQFSVMMTQHLALVTVLPIFYALAAPGTLALRALPRRDDGTRGPREWLLFLLQSWWGRVVAHPVVACAHVVLAMLVLFVTPLFELTLTNHWAHLAMVVHLSITGYLFVNALIGLDPGPSRPPYAARLALLVPPVVFHTVFGLMVLSSSSLLAADFYARLAVPWVPDPLVDQHLGGALTWGVGELPALGLALVIAVLWIRDDQRAQDRDRRRGRSSPLLVP